MPAPPTVLSASWHQARHLSTMYDPDSMESWQACYVGCHIDQYHRGVLCRFFLSQDRRRSRICSFLSNGQMHQFDSTALALSSTPVAVETLGPLNEDAHLLLTDIGRRISAVSGDLHEVHFLCQCSVLTLFCCTTVLFRLEDQPK